MEARAGGRALDMVIGGGSGDGGDGCGGESDVEPELGVEMSVVMERGFGGRVGGWWWR